MQTLQSKAVSSSPARSLGRHGHGKKCISLLFSDFCLLSFLLFFIFALGGDCVNDRTLYFYLCDMPRLSESIKVLLFFFTLHGAVNINYYLFECVKAKYKEVLFSRSVIKYSGDNSH